MSCSSQTNVAKNTITDMGGSYVGAKLFTNDDMDKILDNVYQESGGWVFVMPSHPLAEKSGVVILSRHILSEKIGRWLTPDECASFIDQNPDNLCPDNLMVRSRRELAKLHIGQPNYQSRKVQDRPNREMLIKMVDKYSLMEIGRYFGVDSNSIRKWLKAESIPTKPRGYWSKVPSETLTSLNDLQ